MDIAEVTGLYGNYRSSAHQLDRTAHPDDDMFRKDGWDNYLKVGVSAVDVIIQSLVIAPTETVDRVLDFGCGHGRVARHLKLLFPSARLFFSDIDDSAWQFCAAQFGGEGFASQEDFSQLEVPGEMDLIFLGSVFTHLDRERAHALWTKMFEALAPKGALVASFRGSEAYRMMMSNPERFNQGGYYNQLLEDYRTTGFGYQDYKGFVSWGQNLFSIADVLHLANDHQRARLVGYKEWGWANVHDVAVWSKR